MRSSYLALLLTVVVIVLSVTACQNIRSNAVSLPASHPMELAKGRVDCNECHSDQLKGVLKPYESFRHTSTFIASHRLYAERDDRLCSVCHDSSFCYDCHAVEIEMKPALKLGNRPDRDLPHRGDYLTLHAIDGKVDPTSCYRCHGRGNNERCLTCHR
jgi:hypothetical protein